MIDTSKIENIEELREMKNDLNFFINKKIIAEIYKEQGKTTYELEADRELARELLIHVIKRLTELETKSDKINPSAVKKGKRNRLGTSTLNVEG